MYLRLKSVLRLMHRLTFRKGGYSIGYSSCIIRLVNIRQQSLFILFLGNTNFKKEPNVSISVNNVTWTDLMENTCIKEENVAIENITFLQASNIDNLTLVSFCFTRTMGNIRAWFWLVGQYG